MYFTLEGAPPEFFVHDFHHELDYIDAAMQVLPDAPLDWGEWTPAQIEHFAHETQLAVANDDMNEMYFLAQVLIVE